MKKHILLIVVFVMMAFTSMTAYADILENTSNEDGTLVIPADNNYFPNMTLSEIKAWYTGEVEKFIASGGTTSDLKSFQEDVEDWASDVYDEDKNGMKIEYGMVDKYNKEDTMEFYEVQKKMYDFIQEYEETNDVYLNFANWDIIDNNETTEIETDTTDSTDAVEEETSEEQITKENERTTDKEIKEDAIEKDSDEKDEDESRSILTYWYVILIIVVVIIGAIGFVVKNKKK